MRILSVTSGYPNKINRVKKIFTHEQNLEFSNIGCYVEVINLGAESTVKEPEIYEGIPVFKLSKTGNNILKVLKLKKLLCNLLKNKNMT